MKSILDRIFVDGLGGMAHGLFATLIIGTIIQQIGLFASGDFGNMLYMAGKMAAAMTGAGIGVGVARKFNADQLVVVSAATVGMIGAFAGKLLAGEVLTDGNVFLAGPGEPLGAFVAAYVAIEIGILISGKTKLDILITPFVCIGVGTATGLVVGPPISRFMGWLGSLINWGTEQQPFLMGIVVSVLMGMILTLPIRKMHIRAIKESGLTAADEMLYPENRSYLDDVLSYEAIGARSVENQQHRLTASGMDIPIGMKNPTSGDFSVMLNSVVAAQSSHTFIYRGMDVTTDGNDLAHVILRGGVDKYGTCNPNYHYEDLVRLLEMYQKMDLKNPAAVIDTNHSNSNKQFKEQIRIAMEIMHSRNYNPELKTLIKGLMIESYLEEGCQSIGNERVYGKSITDPCLGWEDTERLIFEIAEQC